MSTLNIIEWLMAQGLPPALPPCVPPLTRTIRYGPEAGTHPSKCASERPYRAMLRGSMPAVVRDLRRGLSLQPLLREARQIRRVIEAAERAHPPTVGVERIPRRRLEDRVNRGMPPYSPSAWEYARFDIDFMVHFIYSQVLSEREARSGFRGTLAQQREAEAERLRLSMDADRVAALNARLTQGVSTHSAFPTINVGAQRLIAGGAGVPLLNRGLVMANMSPPTFGPGPGATQTQDAPQSAPAETRSEQQAREAFEEDALPAAPPPGIDLPPVMTEPAAPKTPWALYVGGGVALLGVGYLLLRKKK